MDTNRKEKNAETVRALLEGNPEAVKALELSAGFRDSHFRYRYSTVDGETVGFLYGVSPTEHYIILNTFELIDIGQEAKMFEGQLGVSP